MDDTRGIRRGMKVVDMNGERLGRVTRADAETFTYARGFPFRKRVRTRYEIVAEVHGHEVRTRQTGAQIEAEAYASPLAKERWGGVVPTGEPA